MGDFLDDLEKDNFLPPLNPEYHRVGFIRRKYGVRPYDPSRAVQAVKNVIEDEAGHLHIDGTGRAIPLYKMDNSHLLNTIAFHSRNLAELIKDNSQYTGPESMLDAIMSAKDMRETCLKNVKQYIGDSYIIIGRYLMEALRRDIIEEARARMMPLTEVINHLAGTTVDGSPIPEITVEAEEKEEK